jgi:hypothetical protein
VGFDIGAAPAEARTPEWFFIHLSQQNGVPHQVRETTIRSTSVV